MDSKKEILRSVDKIMFLKTKDEESEIPKRKVPLVSIHGDGFIRLWDVYDGSMVLEKQLCDPEFENLTCLSLDNDANMLFIGDSSGNVRVIDTRHLAIDYHKKESAGKHFRLRTKWRAHVNPVSSVSYSDSFHAVITSSEDGTVRLWKPDGVHIGIFGHPQSWDIRDIDTFHPMPEDVKTENALDSEREKVIRARNEYDHELINDAVTAIQERVTNKYIKNSIQPTEENSTEGVIPKLVALRTTSLQRAYGAKWKSAL